jgi:tellurite methyltransferase
MVGLLPLEQGILVRIQVWQQILTMSPWTNWSEFYELTKNKPPRHLLVKALPYVKTKDNAVDLGAGALNDTVYLLSDGFNHVTAVDKEPVAKEIAIQLPPEKFQYVISSLEKYAFPIESFDLVSAQYALPFIPSEHFDEVWGLIRKSLKTDGIFTGQLFGDRDEWSGSKNMTFHTVVEARKLLSDFELISFEEEEADKATAAGIMKHWHVFHFIARK